ncbi:MAG: YhbY family RNA-binding protein [Candidatus Bathyarchaeota archaeon]|nr:MAG: YhbY family RNA-binding protein [Candidatus Bathyarchaeota archaeon]
MITSRKKRSIKRRLNSERPTIWIGKEGATSQIQGEICRQLEQKEVVKVKMLKTALKDEDAAQIAFRLAQQTESELIDLRGHTFILYKQRKHEM